MCSVTSSDDGLHSVEMAGLSGDGQSGAHINAHVISDTYDSDDSQGDPVFMPPQAALGIDHEGQLPLGKLASMTAIPEEDDSMIMRETTQES